MRITLDASSQHKRRPGRAGAGLPMVGSEATEAAKIIRFAPPRVKRREAAALSSLIDQAVAREEEAAGLAAYYSQQAARHRAIRSSLEALIP